MAFIAHFGGDLKEGTSREFQEWLDKNGKEFANSYPAGARYIATCFAIYAAKGTGGVHNFVEMDSYGIQDDLAAAGKDTGSVYGQLLNELASFLDQNSENWTSALYKQVTAATIFGED